MSYHGRIWIINAWNDIAISQSVLKNDLVGVRHHVSFGADLNEKDHLGRTPLHLALMNNYDAIAEYLINEGADPNAEDNNGETPLSLTWEKKPILFALLLANGGKTDNSQLNWQSAFIQALAYGGIQTVITLLVLGADPNGSFIYKDSKDKTRHSIMKTIPSLQAPLSKTGKEMLHLMVAAGGQTDVPVNNKLVRKYELELEKLRARLNS